MAKAQTSNGRVRKAMRRIKDAYRADSDPWIVGYSGGKDSTAVLQLVYRALSRLRHYHKPVTVVYCNTGVEIPCASRLALKALREFRRECREQELPIQTAVVRPRLSERFFAKVIGRGYPPPTDKFRWCTDRLITRPVFDLLRKKRHQRAAVVVGVREDESSTRSLTLQENPHEADFWRQQRGYVSRRLFMPILDFTVKTVWHLNLASGGPKSLRTPQLADLYADASGCPDRRARNGAPCVDARFGCWTCTVSKHGVTLRNLINAGRKELSSLLDFRLWLEAERDNPRYRWRRRRNGDPGPGPMTMRWRRKALDKLLAAQRLSGISLIGDDEVSLIRQMWRQE